MQIVIGMCGHVSYINPTVMEVALRTKDKGAPKIRGHRQMLTLSLPPDLVTKVDTEAANEHRSRANMLEVILRERYDLASRGEAA